MSYAGWMDFDPTRNGGSMRGPCKKQPTQCTIIRETGEQYSAWNTCDIEGEECPRAGRESGCDYHLCRSLHAEANAAKLAAETKDVPGTAYLYGHDWFCRQCQHALLAVNVNTFVMVGSPIQEASHVPE